MITKDTYVLNHMKIVGCFETLELQGWDEYCLPWSSSAIVNVSRLWCYASIQLLILGIFSLLGKVTRFHITPQYETGMKF